LHWPALPLRPGERLAAGRTCWETFVKAAPADRLADAERVALAPSNGLGTVEQRRGT